MAATKLGWIATLIHRVSLRLTDRRIRMVEAQMAQESALHDQMVDDLVRELNTLIRKRAAMNAAHFHRQRYQQRMGGRHV